MTFLEGDEVKIVDIGMASVWTRIDIKLLGVTATFCEYDKRASTRRGNPPEYVACRLWFRNINEIGDDRLIREQKKNGYVFFRSIKLELEPYMDDKTKSSLNSLSRS